MTANPKHPAAPAESAPLFSVVRGTPTDEEVAALTAVVLSLGSATPAAEPKRRFRSWIRRHQLRLQPEPGPGSWRRSRG